MKKVLLAVLIAATVMLCACSVFSKTVVGTWSHKENVLGVVTETVYVFKEDGTGSMKNIIETKFTYTTEDNKLTITTKPLGIELVDEYTYSFDGGKLCLTKDSKTITLEKAD